MGLRVTMVGSGALGDVQPGWSVTEECTPVALGDTSGSVGTASVDAGLKRTSRFVLDNTATLGHEVGNFRGQIADVGVGHNAHVSVQGGLAFTVTDRVMPPVWFGNSAVSPTVRIGPNVSQVANPYGIAVSKMLGYGYYTSYGTVGGVERVRVVRFDTATGAYVSEWGAPGNGFGQFGPASPFPTSPGPSGVAINTASGYTVYVYDGFNSRVQVFTSAGVSAGSFGSAGSGNGQFNVTTATARIAFDSAGNVYVTDSGNSRLQKFTNTGTYLGQVSLAGWWASPAGLTIDANDNVIVSLLTAPGYSPAAVRIYNTSLVLQSSFTHSYTYDSTLFSGFPLIAAGTSNTLWAVPLQTNHLIRLDYTGAELERYYLNIAGSSVGIDTFALAADGDDVYVLAQGPAQDSGSVLYGFTGNLASAIDYSPVSLSAAIEQYMRSCDETLAGYTFDYQAADDPVVVFPGWVGDVWTKLKELCAAYALEIALVDDVITVRDIAQTTISVPNRTPAVTVPERVQGGRQVNIVYQNPVAGGGLMYDAAAAGDSWSVGAGESFTRTITTSNHPAELATVSAVDTVAAQAGQYYVVDSTGAHVPSGRWRAAGASVLVALGATPGTMVFTVIGPTAEVPGFTGPYRFASGILPTSVPVLSVTGNGTFTTPQTLELLTGYTGPQEVWKTIDSPFVDTLERAYDRGGWASALASGPQVTVTFSVASSSLPGFGQTVGCLFPFESSIYRIVRVVWGDLSAQVTAVRHTTVDDVDDTWAGEDIDTYDAFWAGYSLDDQHIQPLAH